MIDTDKHIKPTHITLTAFVEQQEFFIDEFKKNKILILPTDTLYGISALFTVENIGRINAIKQSDSQKKLSIIAPSFDRIEKHFVVQEPMYIQECFEKYHGVTYVLLPKITSQYFSFFQEWFNDPTIWVRILKHPIQQFVKQLGEPIISTSANISGEANHTTIETLWKQLTEQVDYIVDQGSIFGKPSVLIFVDEKKVLERS